MTTPDQDLLDGEASNLHHAMRRLIHARNLAETVKTMAFEEEGRKRAALEHIVTLADHAGDHIVNTAIDACNKAERCVLCIARSALSGE